MMRVERNEELLNSAKPVSNLPLSETEMLSSVLELRAEIDSMIEQGMTDLWLLLTGEGLGASPYRRNRDGNAFAMLFDGQIHLLGPKLSVLDALRSVGLDLGMQDSIYEG